MFGTDGLSIELDEHSVVYIIKELFIPDKIDSNIFINNYLALMPYVSKNISPLQVQEFYGVRDKGNTTTSPSISYFLNPTKRAPTFPLWFIAAYPDVMHWFHKTQNELAKNNADKHGENNYDMADIVLNIWGMDMNKVIQLDDEGCLIDKNRKHHPKPLRVLIDSYLQKTGKSLEVSTMEGLKENFISGSLISEDTNNAKDNSKGKLTDEHDDYEGVSENTIKTPLSVYLIAGLLCFVSLIIFVENARIYADISTPAVFLLFLSGFIFSTLPAVVGIGLLYKIRYAYITTIAICSLVALIPLLTIFGGDFVAFIPLLILAVLILFGLLRKNVREFFK